MPSEAWIVLGVVVTLAGLVALLVIGQFLNLYIQATLSGAPIAMIQLIGMRLRKTDVRTVVLNRIRSEKAGLGLTVSHLETHALAGGRLTHIVSAMIAARERGIELSWQDACAQDLDDRNAPDGNIRPPPRL